MRAVFFSLILYSILSVAQPYPEYATEPTRTLHRRGSTRTSKFMAQFTKGAKAWKSYIAALEEGKDEMKSTFSMESAGASMSTTKTVDKDGWWYRDYTAKWEEHIAISTLVSSNLDINLVGYEAREYRNPNNFYAIMYFDCKNGIMVSSSAYFKTEGDNPVASDYRWSDVAWELWTIKCSAHKTHLRYIVRENIQNPVSELVLDETLKARKINPADYSPTKITWKNGVPTCDESSGDCDFYSLVHTPNVIGTLFLTKDHASKLEFPRVASIKAWKSVDQEWWSAIKLESLEC
ncbi:hypothetical protein N7495_005113 [Penicillium taxi]|uniref:uncharacterized protein n=1 Tax=Penicillium taxi TaxID=168475 RepID=UPI002545A0DA|nr:uncharacterized protein N7495_005113 [Penicillium taxi]KAJ5893422.1 hypothetical protein N7495_005113 [Penicillium taxi]